MSRFTEGCCSGFDMKEQLILMALILALFLCCLNCLEKAESLKLKAQVAAKTYQTGKIP